MTLTYGFLGPKGTFTHEAAIEVSTSEDTLIPFSNVTATLDSIRIGACQKALVPIENSVEGVVARTLDELAMGEPLVITAEIALPVSFALMVLPATNRGDVKSIATHPHAESQCRSFIAKNYPNAQIIESASTAAAAKGLIKGDYDAAIASKIAAKNYQLKVIASDISDNKSALTRFVMVEKPGKIPSPTGKDRTSLAVFIGNDHAGALFEILSIFAKNQVNLTFIQSRPTGAGLGDYHFIIDVEGHIQDKQVADTIAELKLICQDIRFLGSYPKAKR
jgi:prephenate dehydratase